LEGVALRFYPDSGRAFQALGVEAQGFGGLDAGQLAAVLESSGLALYSARLPMYGAVIFNQQNPGKLPFFQDEAARLALVQSIDREGVVAETLGAQAQVADSTILPGTWAFNPALAPAPYDPARAGQLLDGAGWVLNGSRREKAGQPLAFTLLVADSPIDKQIGEALRDGWAAIGVEVRVQALDPAELLARLAEPPTAETGRGFEAALVEFSQGGLADPDPYPFWHGSQIAEGQNLSGFSNRDIDEALEIARADPNGVRRAELYRAYQQWFVESGAALLLYHPVYHYTLSCQVDGAQLTLLASPADRFRNLHEWRILPPDQAAQLCP
jgi:peptide/nickel transport system substrate-binding protein